MQDPLIFLPGMMCDARLFAPQIAAFSHNRPVMVFPLTGANTMSTLARTILAIRPAAFCACGTFYGWDRGNGDDPASPGADREAGAP